MCMRAIVELSVAAGLVIGLASSLGCKGEHPSESPTIESPTTESEAPADAGDDSELGLVGGTTSVSQELSPELLGELREGEGGRIVVVAPGFIAASRCTDCGAPTYLRFLAVRCADELHCEVLTEQCEGKISRAADRIDIQLEVIEGVEGASCSDYSGSFERGP